VGISSTKNPNICKKKGEMEREVFLVGHRKSYCRGGHHSFLGEGSSNEKTEKERGGGRKKYKSTKEVLEKGIFLGKQSSKRAFSANGSYIFENEKERGEGSIVH